MVQFQGIPSGVALNTNSPEGGRGGPGGLELHQTLEWGWSLRPGFTPGRVVQKCSTIIQGSHGVIDLSFVYTLSLLVTVYTQSLLV